MNRQTETSGLFLPCQIYGRRIGKQSLDISGVKLHRNLTQMDDPRPHYSPSSLTVGIREDTEISSRGGSQDPSQGMGLPWAFGFAMNSVYLEF